MCATIGCFLDIGVGGPEGTIEKLATAKQVFKFPLVLSTFQKQGGAETLMSCSQHSRVAACMEQGGRLLMKELPEGGVAENFACDFRAQAFELNAGIELDVENYVCPLAREEKKAKDELYRRLCAEGINGNDVDEVARMKKCGCKVLGGLDPYRHLASDDKEKWENLSEALNKDCNAPVNEMKDYSVEQCAEVKCEFGTLFQKKQLSGETGYSGNDGACDLGYKNIYKGIERQKNSKNAIFSNASCDAAKSMCGTERGPYGKGGFYPVKIFTSGATALYQCVRCRNRKGQYVCPFYTGANEAKAFHENLQNAQHVAEACLSGGLLWNPDPNNPYGNMFNEDLSSGDFYTLCEKDAAFSGIDSDDCHKCLGDAARYNNAVAEILGHGAFEFETPCSDEADSDCPCYSHPYGCPLGTKDLVKQCNDCKDEKYKDNSWCVERYNQCKTLDACRMENKPEHPVRIRWSFLGKGNNDQRSHFYTYECPLKIEEKAEGVDKTEEFNFYIRVPSILGAKRLGPSDKKVDDTSKKWGVALPELQKKNGRFEVKKDKKTEAGFFKPPFNPFPRYTFQKRTLEVEKEKEEDEEKFKKDFNFLQNLESNSEVYASYALGCYEEDPKSHDTIAEYSSYANENPNRWKDAKIVGKFEDLLQQEYDLVFNFYKGNTFDEAGSDTDLPNQCKNKDNTLVTWDHVKKALSVKGKIDFEKWSIETEIDSNSSNTNNTKRYKIAKKEGPDTSTYEYWGFATETTGVEPTEGYDFDTSKPSCNECIQSCTNKDEHGNCNSWEYKPTECKIDVNDFERKYKAKGEEKIKSYIKDKCKIINNDTSKLAQEFVNCRRWFHCDKNKHNRPLYEYRFVIKDKEHYTKKLLTAGPDGTEKRDSKNPYNRCIYFAKKYGRKFANTDKEYEAENFIETNDGSQHKDKNGNEYKYVKMYFDQEDLKDTYWDRAAKNTVYYLGPRKTKDCIDHSILNLDKLEKDPEDGMCKIPQGSP